MAIDQQALEASLLSGYSTSGMINLGNLKAALAAEGVNIDGVILDRVFRRLSNPGGCEYCGAATAVGVVKRGYIVRACCGKRMAKLPKEEPEGPADDKEQPHG